MEETTLADEYIDLGAVPARIIQHDWGSMNQLAQCGLWFEQLQREFPSAELAIVKAAKWTVLATWSGTSESPAMDAAFDASLHRSVDWDELTLRKIARDPIFKGA